MDIVFILIVDIDKVMKLKQGKRKSIFNGIGI